MFPLTPIEAELAQLPLLPWTLDNIFLYVQTDALCKRAVLVLASGSQHVWSCPTGLTSTRKGTPEEQAIASINTLPEVCDTLSTRRFWASVRHFVVVSLVGMALLLHQRTQQTQELFQDSSDSLPFGPQRQLR